MNEHKQPSNLDSVKKCPSCGGELDRGYAMTQAIQWDTQKSRVFRGPKHLLTRYPAWTYTTYPTLRCVKCQVVLIDYGRNV